LEVLKAEASLAADRSFITGGGSVWFASVDQRTTLKDEVIKLCKNVIAM
jgi:membrane-bound lytic murein transglycosylase